MENKNTPWSADELSKKKFIISPKAILITKIVGGGFAVLLFLIFAITSFISFFAQPTTGITFEFNAPREVLVGEPFELEVSLTNDSGNVLKQASLAIGLPDPVAFIGKEDGTSVIEESVGDILPGTVKKFQYQLVAIGGSQTVARIKTALNYRRSNTSADFRENNMIDITIDRPAIEVDYIVPQKIVIGQPFPIEIKAKHQGKIDFSKVFVALNPPANFKIDALSPEAQEEPATWVLNNFSPGSEAVFNVTGTLVGKAGNFITLGTNISVEHNGQKYEIVMKEASLPLTAAPLSVQIFLNGSEKATPSIGKAVNYSVAVKNNSDVPLENVSVRLKLSSDLFDYRGVQSDAFFNSADSSFLWTAGNQSGLLKINPGETRQVLVTLALRPDFPTVSLSDKNYVLLADAVAESTTLPPGVKGQKTSAKTSLQSRVRGLASFSAKAFYKEVGSNIENTGPFPPRANVPTQYTVHWAISSEAVDLRDIAVSAFLEPQARFTGRSYTNTGVDPIYNPASGQITWNVPSVRANQGKIGPPAELVFQIEVTPSVSQLGGQATIIGETIFQAVDVFVGETASSKVSALTTNLPFDTSIQGLDTRVVK